MSTYLGQVHAIMDKFEMLMPVIVNVEKQQEHIRTLFLVLTLAGLHLDHDLVRDQILFSPIIPTIDQLFSRLFCLATPPRQRVVSSSTIDSSIRTSQQ